MIPAVLCLVATASARTEVRSETVLQMRHDFFGESFVPTWEVVQLDTEAGKHLIHGYLGLEWPNGVPDGTDPDLYALTAAGSAGKVGWTLGRQQVLTQRRMQTIDGARATFAATDSLEIGVWGGYARHQDLDDFVDGIGAGRLDLTWRGPLLVRVGGWVEADPDAETVIREDAEAWWAGKAKARPDLKALVSVAQPFGGEEAAVLVDRANLELAVSPLTSLRTTLTAGQRRSPDADGMLGEAVLDAFAPEGVLEVGGQVRVSDARWAALSTGYNLSTFLLAEERQFGHTVHAWYQPGLKGSSFTLVPGYRFQSGPGGLYHAGYATVTWAVLDTTRLGLKGAVVPYRKLHDDWDTAADVGASLAQGLGKAVTLTGEVDLARDAQFEREVRGGLVLLVEVP